MYTKSALSLAEAKAALEAMLQKAAAEPQRPLVMAVVDENGELLCYAAMDGARPMPRRLAFKKAYTAAVAGADTLAYAERLKSMGRSVADLGDPNLTNVQGGLCIVKDGAVLGGIGVSGRRAEEDEEVARVGLQALNL